MSRTKVVATLSGADLVRVVAAVKLVRQCEQDLSDAKTEMAYHELQLRRFYGVQPGDVIDDTSGDVLRPISAADDSGDAAAGSRDAANAVGRALVDAQAAGQHSTD